MIDIFLHLGMPKAASTFLQVKVFSECPEICYLGKFSNASKVKHKHRYTNPIFKKLHSYCLAAPDSSSSFSDDDKQELYDYLLTIDPQKKLLFTDEKYTFYDASFDQVMRRLVECFGHDKIRIKPLIILRKQDDAIYSMYSMLRHTFTSTLSSMVENPKRHTSFFIAYDYEYILGQIEKQIPLDDICIMKFEDLFNNRQKFFDGLSGYFGLESLKSFGKKELSIVNAQTKSDEEYHRSVSMADMIKHILMFYKRARPDWLQLRNLPLGKWISKQINLIVKTKVLNKGVYEISIPIEGDVKKKIMKMYESSNTVIQKKYVIDLSDWEH